MKTDLMTKDPDTLKEKSFKSPLLIIILASLLYFAFIRPTRLIVNSKIHYPFISTIFSDYIVVLSPNNTAAVVVDKDESDKHLWLALPFGVFYVIPMVLLLIQRNGPLVRKLTFYHLFLSIIPIFYLMAIGKLANFIPSNIFQRLNIVLGSVFTILAIKKSLASTQ